MLGFLLENGNDWNLDRPMHTAKADQNVALIKISTIFYMTVPFIYSYISNRHKDNDKFKRIYENEGI